MATDKHTNDLERDEQRLREIELAAVDLIEEIGQAEVRPAPDTGSTSNNALNLHHDLGELADEYRRICKRLKKRDALGMLAASLGRTPDYIRKHAQFAEVPLEIVKEWVEDGESWHSLLKRSMRWPTSRRKRDPDVLDLY